MHGNNSIEQKRRAWKNERGRVLREGEGKRQNSSSVSMFVYGVCFPPRFVLESTDEVGFLNKNILNI